MKLETWQMDKVARYFLNYVEENGNPRITFDEAARILSEKHEIELDADSLKKSLKRAGVIK